jgi:hypothetical protein
VIREVYSTLRRLWTSADLIPALVRMKLVAALVATLFLNSDLIFSKSAIGLTNRLRIAMNSCATFNIPRGDPISQHSAKILGMPLNRSCSYRICCQKFKIVNSVSPSYLTDRIQVGHSLWTRVLHISRHSLASTAHSFFVCSPAMWNSLPISVRTESRERKFRAVCWEFLKVYCVAYF